MIGTGRRAADRQDDGGFVLLESLIAITLITIIMGAMATFFVNGVTSTNQQRARQAATQLADTAVESIRSLNPSDLVTGRDSASVTTQFGAASALVSGWLATMTAAADASATAGSGPTATVPTVAVTQTVNHLAFSISKYLGWCAVPAGAAAVDCDRTHLSSGVRYLRAVVAVTWSDSHCTAGVCTYLTATLINTADDPTFNLNQFGQPPPVVAAPDRQDSYVGDPVSLQLAVEDGTGAPTFTWQSTALPAGLTLSPSGLISGSATSAVANLTVTITVTDAFLRTASATFTWTVVPRVRISGGSDQVASVGTAIPAILLTATGGSGAPYTWTDPTGSLPPGLSITTVTNQGRVSGTPTTAGSYPVQLMVRDSSTPAHTATVTFTWAVYATLVVSTPPAQVSTVGTPISPLPIVVTGGSGSFLWTGGGTLPAGLTLTGGTVTGTPPVLGTTTVGLSVTDTVTGITRSVSFVWSVVPPVVVSGGTSQLGMVGTAITAVTLTATGGSGAPYTWSDPTGSLPPGLGIATVSSQGRVTGTPTAAGSYPVQLQVTDAKGGTATTSFTWTVYPAMVVSNPGALANTVGVAITALPITVSGGSGTHTIASSGLPAGLTMTPSGVITGSPTTTGTSTVTVTVTDTVTGLVKTVGFTWTVHPRPTVTSPGNLVTSTGAPMNLPLTTTCLNSPCTYTLTGGPAGVSITALGVLTGTVTSSPQTFGAVSITVRDADGVTATTATFTVTVRAAPTVNSPGNQVTTVGATISLTLTHTCANTPCSYTLNGGPAGLSVSSSGVIAGTVTGSARTYSPVSVTIRDAAGSPATTPAFAWTVNPAPAIANPGAQTVYIGTAVTLDLAAIATGGTAPYTYSATNLPGWLSLDPATGLITGTAPGTKSVTTNVRVGVTDAAGVSATSAAFTWTVTNLRLDFGDQTTYRRTTVSIDLDSHTSGGTAPYSFSITNRPSWLSYSTSSHTLTGRAPSGVTDDSDIVISVTDSAGVVITNPPIAWHVTTLRWSSNFGNRWNAHDTSIASFSLTSYDSGGTAPYSYAGIGLPPGITVDPTTGAVTGTPTTPGSYSVQFVESDSHDATVTSNSFTWTIT